MHYRNFRTLDYKYGIGSNRPPRRHWRLRLVLLISSLIILSVVLAKTQEMQVDLRSPDAPDLAVKRQHDTQNLSPHVPPEADSLPPDNPASNLTASALALEQASTDQPVAERVEPASAPPAVAQAKASNPPAPPQSRVVLRDDGWHELTIQPGDSLSLVFSELYIHSQLKPILALGRETRVLNAIHPGEKIRVLKNEAGALQALVYEGQGTRTLKVRRTAHGYQAQSQERQFETRIAQGSGVITHSLFMAGIEAGLSDTLIMNMAKILAWDIDFALDIREGDHFTVIYERQYLDNQYVRDGNILAVAFVNRGREVRALRYVNPDGDADYYDPKGHLMRKTFLRTPVEFARVSSHFGMRRHPILHTMREHRGVDYAAPTGTPIRAAGDGRVAFMGDRGGYGKTVILQHSPRHRTLYAHMNNFARGLQEGDRVRQGDLIGYVGMTGLATGPHLHYEFHEDGRHIDPLTVTSLPDADRLPSRQLAEFQRNATPLLAQLDTLSPTRMAQQRGQESTALD